MSFHLNIAAIHKSLSALAPPTSKKEATHTEAKISSHKIKTNTNEVSLSASSLTKIKENKLYSEPKVPSIVIKRNPETKEYFIDQKKDKCSSHIPSSSYCFSSNISSCKTPDFYINIEPVNQTSTSVPHITETETLSNINKQETFEAQNLTRTSPSINPCKTPEYYINIEPIDSTLADIIHSTETIKKETSFVNIQNPVAACSSSVAPYSSVPSHQTTTRQHTATVPPIKKTVKRLSVSNRRRPTFFTSRAPPLPSPVTHDDFLSFAQRTPELTSYLSLFTNTVELSSLNIVQLKYPRVNVFLIKDNNKSITVVVQQPNSQ